MDHLVLRPGLRLVRRADGGWEVAALVMRDRPGMAWLARSLSDPWTEHPAGFDDVLEALSPYLVPAGALHHLRPSDPMGTGAYADLVAEHGAAAGEVGDRRAGARVRVTGPDPWTGRAASLLAAYGVGLEDSEPDVRLLVHLGEPAPGLVESVLGQRVTHLWVGTVGREVSVGPFTEATRSPCRGCVEAERSVRRPGSALARRQYAGSTGVPEPVDPASMVSAIALAVSDVVRWVDGQQPATWGRTVTWRPGGDLVVPETESWPRHPECGCGWSGAWWHWVG